MSKISDYLFKHNAKQLGIKLTQLSCDLNVNDEISEYYAEFLQDCGKTIFNLLNAQENLQARYMEYKLRCRAYEKAIAKLNRTAEAFVKKAK
jgi:hypothetical protein